MFFLFAEVSAQEPPGRRSHPALPARAGSDPEESRPLTHVESRAAVAFAARQRPWTPSAPAVVARAKNTTVAPPPRLCDDSLESHGLDPPASNPCGARSTTRYQGPPRCRRRDAGGPTVPSCPAGVSTIATRRARAARAASRRLGGREALPRWGSSPIAPLVGPRPFEAPRGASGTWKAAALGSYRAPRRRDK